MSSTAAHVVTVVGPSNGQYFLGYYKPDAAFFIIQPFFNGDLACAAADLLNRARRLTSSDEVCHGR